MPPQQADGLLDLVDDELRFGAHWVLRGFADGDSARTIGTVPEAVKPRRRSAETGSTPVRCRGGSVQPAGLAGGNLLARPRRNVARRLGRGELAADHRIAVGRPGSRLECLHDDPGSLAGGLHAGLAV